MNKYSLILSLLLHIALIYIFFRTNIPENSMNETIVELSVIENSDIKNGNKDDKNSNILEKEKEAKVSCKNFYIGVGIIVYLVELNGIYYESVYEVKKGYGAWKAGLMAGDIILYTSEPFKGGSPGTTVKTKILRGEKEMFLEITKDKVCTEE